MRALARHPEWSLLIVAAAAWAVLALLVWVPVSGGEALMPHGHDPSTIHQQGIGHQLAMDSTSYPTALRQAVTVWLVMAVAMMLPTTVPMVRYVAFATRRTRRQRSILFFCLGYLAVWALLGLPVTLLDASMPQLPPVAVAILVALTAAWELTPIKRRALRRCHRTHPVRYRGWLADRSSLGFGYRHGSICLLIGGPAMVTLMVVGHPWPATIAVAAVMLAQKGLVRPERWRSGVAVGGILTGLLVLAFQ